MALAASLSVAIVAQEKITGYVYDASHNAIAGATVVMLSSADSAYINGGVSDAQGRFVMPRPRCKWMMAVSCLGYETAVVRPDGDSVAVTLIEAQHQLGEVTVRSSRPVSQLTPAASATKYVARLWPMPAGSKMCWPRCRLCERPKADTM